MPSHALCAPPGRCWLVHGSRKGTVQCCRGFRFLYVPFRLFCMADLKLFIGFGCRITDSSRELTRVQLWSDDETVAVVWQSLPGWIRPASVCLVATFVAFHFRVWRNYSFTRDDGHSPLHVDSRLNFQSPLSCSGWARRRLPPLTCIVLPVLTDFGFKGVSEYQGEYLESWTILGLALCPTSIQLDSTTWIVALGYNLLQSIKYLIHHNWSNSKSSVAHRH